MLYQFLLNFVDNLSFLNVFKYLTFRTGLSFFTSDKVFVKGKMASLIYKKISNSKKGKILRNKSEIDDLIRNDIKNNDYLMIKASLATGLNKIVNEIKGLN